MTGLACCFSFNLCGWRVASNRLTDEQAWAEWAAGGVDVSALPEYKPDVAFLPVMQRRRLGASARLFFDAAWPLAEAFPECPMVYASHDGEINRSFELWLALLGEGSVSPTSFGLSVHNAQTGQWSMLRGDHSENTALSVQADSLETALAEAYALLTEGAPKVMVVVADDPVRTAYDTAVVRAPMAYALAMVVEKGDGFTLSKLKAGAPEMSADKTDYWSALNWVRHTLAGTRQWQHEYSHSRWQWQVQR